jgi:hypothetical protein
MLWLAVEKPRAWSNTIVILACISAVVFYALYTWVSRDRLHASRPSYSVVQPQSGGSLEQRVRAWASIHTLTGGDFSSCLSPASAPRRGANPNGQCTVGPKA